jgi:hypothetical protein
MPPKFTIKEIPISQIDNNFGQIEGVPENPRTITTEDFQNLKKSLDDDPGFLWLREPLVYPLKGRYVAIAGNQRIRALKELPVEFTPAKILDADTPVEDLIRWAVKDNTNKGEWDWDQLGNEWDEYPLEEWGLNIPSIPDLNFDEIESTADRETKKTPIKVRCPECECEFEV